MFLLLGTTDDGRSRVCTATADQALKHYARMTRDGLAPNITDRHGREVNPSVLAGRAKGDAHRPADAPAGLDL